MSHKIEDYSKRVFGNLLLGWMTPAPSPGMAETNEARASRLSFLLQGLYQKSGPATRHEPTRGEVDTARRRQRHEARTQMLNDIMAMHARLCTGLTTADVKRLGAVLVAHQEADPGTGLLRHAVDHGWQRLMTLTQQANFAWPPYPELTYGLSPDEADRVLEEHRRDSHEWLRNASAARLADLMVGEIRNWPDTYPHSSERVWVETCLEGVAAALAAQSYHEPPFEPQGSSMVVSDAVL